MDDLYGRSKTPYNKTDSRGNQAAKYNVDSNAVVNQQNEEAVRSIVATNAKISAETQTPNEEVYLYKRKFYLSMLLS